MFKIIFYQLHNITYIPQYSVCFPERRSLLLEWHVDVVIPLLTKTHHQLILTLTPHPSPLSLYLAHQRGVVLCVYILLGVQSG
jgi:hypothetical protein